MKEEKKKPEPYCPAQIKDLVKEAEDRAMDRIRSIAEKVWRREK
jgi:hypothetical protein